MNVVLKSHCHQGMVHHHLVIIVIVPGLFRWCFFFLSSFFCDSFPLFFLVNSCQLLHIPFVAFCFTLRFFFSGSRVKLGISGTLRATSRQPLPTTLCETLAWAKITA